MITTSIIRRVRRTLGDDYASLFGDTTITEAIQDYLEDEITPLNSVIYTADSDYILPDLAVGYPRIIAAGVSLLLLRGERVAAARDAVSLDSPSGRINLQEPGKQLAAIVAAIETEYVLAMSLVDAFVPLPSYIRDMSVIETIRVTTDGSGG